MRKSSGQYKLFFEFLETFSAVGFTEIDRNDPLVVALEAQTKINDQFFLVFDVIRMKIEFTSQRSLQMLGIKHEVLNPYHFKEATHPDDLTRNELGITKIFKIAHELFIAKKGEMLISSNFRFRNITGTYSNQLVQIYLFYKAVPNETVYMLNINTDIEWGKRMKHGYHYYLGTDMSFFKYPDQELLMIGNIFSDREFQIIKLIESGMSSVQIAKKLFVSTFTINTHRRNILDKTGKAHISEVIYDLKEQGLL